MPGSDTIVSSRIRLLAPDDAAAYRALRLRALREHPDAFTSSFEEEDVRPPGWSETRLRPDPARPHDFFLGAFVQGVLEIGRASCRERV